MNLLIYSRHERDDGVMPNREAGNALFHKQT